jgi:FMN phosphatase YigB (HAD superfamily)
VTFGCVGTLVERVDGSNLIHPIADVEPMLAELRARHYRLGVLTNSADREFEAVHRTFRRPFDLFVTSERILGRKPAPWHFRAFEQLARVCRTHWVHVACSWDYDIVPATALGISAVWLDRERSVARPHATSVRVYTAGEAVDAIARHLEGSGIAMAV